MTNHAQTYHVQFLSGPLRGRTVTVVAADDWQAAKQIAYAIGLDAMNCADWPQVAPVPGLFDAEPVQAITINQALEALNA